MTTTEQPMDLLDDARKNARTAWQRGRRWFGPVLSEDEAVAIGVAAVFELQAAHPDLPLPEMLRGVRTRVLNTMRDEVRFLRRGLPLDTEVLGVTRTSPESRLDGAARADWLAAELEALPWNDRRLLQETLLHSAGVCRSDLPRRFGSRWTIRRGLDRVVQGLRQRAERRFGCA